MAQPVAAASRTVTTTTATDGMALLAQRLHSLTEDGVKVNPLSLGGRVGRAGSREVSAALRHASQA